MGQRIRVPLLIIAAVVGLSVSAERAGAQQLLQKAARRAPPPKEEQAPAAILAPAIAVAQPAEAVEPQDVAGPAALAQSIDEPVAEAPMAQIVVEQAIVEVAPDGNDAQIEAQVKAMENQFLQQYRPLLISELYFLRKVCRPSKEIGLQLTESGQQALAKAAKEAADVQRNMMQGRFAVFPGNNAYPDARKMIREALLESARQVLSEEQVTVYEGELQKRIDSRKRVMVKYLTAKIDNDLALSHDQRQQIMENLESNWDQAWDQHIEMIMYGDNFLPAIPDQLVTEFLTRTQKQIWQYQNRNRGAVVGGFGMFFPGMAVEAADINWDEAAPQNANP